MSWLTAAFCLKPVFPWGQDRRRRSISYTLTAPVSSPCVAIMGVRAGAERNWLRETWSLHTERRWRGSLRRWRMKRQSLHRLAEYAGPIAETPSGAWLLSARTAAGAHYAIRLWNPAAALDAGTDKNFETVSAIAGEDLVDRSRLRHAPAPIAILPGCTRGTTQTCSRWTRASRAKALCAEHLRPCGCKRRTQMVAQSSSARLL